MADESLHWLIAATITRAGTGGPQESPQKPGIYDRDIDGLHCGDTIVCGESSQRLHNEGRERKRRQRSFHSLAP